MKILRLTALATMLGLSSAVCATASTDSNFVCMITGAGINVHWKTDLAGNYYEMMVDAPQTGAAGFTGVGWNPTNPTGNKMIGSTILMGGTGDLTTVKRYSPADTVQANVLATLTTIPATITQTAITSANSRITLKFRRTGVSTGSLLTIFAYGNTGTLTAHTSTNRAASTINLADGVATTPTPTTAIPTPTVVTCLPSTLIHTGTTRYDCMQPLSTVVTMHWNKATTGTTQIAASTTNVNGWFAVSFPTNVGAMAPATAVAMSSTTTAGIYAITARTAAGITTTTSTVVSSPTTELTGGLRILRYNAAVSILTSTKAVNFAYHSSEFQFPVNQHTTRGSSVVNFVLGTTTGTPSPVAAVTTTVMFVCNGELAAVAAQRTLFTTTVNNVLGGVLTCQSLCRNTGSDCFNCNGVRAREASVLAPEDWTVLMTGTSTNGNARTSLDTALTTAFAAITGVNYRAGSANIVVGTTSDDDDGLSGGAIAGIVIGCVAFVVIVVVVVYCLCCKGSDSEADADADKGDTNPDQV